MSATPPVTTAADLFRRARSARARDFVALDTEFMRESTYFPKLCLIQAATSDACAVLDPLAVPDLDSLWQFRIARGTSRCCTRHGRTSEVLTTATPGQPVPGPIFDTQIAAALLGHPRRSAMARSWRSGSVTSLAKGHTRTDWTRRPLSPEQLSTP
jgi:ribonuclease D